MDQVGPGADDLSRPVGGRLDLALSLSGIRRTERLL